MNKNFIIKICVNRDEHAKIKREARFSKKSMSSFVRERLFQNEE
jgi:hypothetical protein